jgi:hypothetical protein
VNRGLPVDNYLRILRLFPSGDEETGFGSNEILRLTGKSDKQQVYRDIKALIKVKILYSKKGRHVGFKQPKYLTPIGKKIRQFVEDMDQYRDSCAAFRSKMSELPTHIYGDNKIICKERFQNLVKIDSIDIDKVRKDYDKFVDSTSSLAPSTVVINNILIRFCMLLTELKEKSVKDILTQIVINAVSSELLEMAQDNSNTMLQKLSLLNKNPGTRDNNKSVLRSNSELWEERHTMLSYIMDPYMYEVGSIYRKMSGDTWNMIVGISMNTNILDFFYLSKEFKEMAKTTLRILPPDNGNARARVKAVKDLVDEDGDKKNRIQSIISICEEGYRIRNVQYSLITDQFK